MKKDAFRRRDALHRVRLPDEYCIRDLRDARTQRQRAADSGSRNAVERVEFGGFFLFSVVFEDGENEDQDQDVDASVETGEEKIFDNAEDVEGSLGGLAFCRVTVYTEKKFCSYGTIFLQTLCCLIFSWPLHILIAGII